MLNFSGKLISINLSTFQTYSKNQFLIIRMSDSQKRVACNISKVAFPYQHENVERLENFFKFKRDYLLGKCIGQGYFDLFYIEMIEIKSIMQFHRFNLGFN